MTDVPPPPAWYADPTGRWQGFFGRMREDHQQKTADRTTFENLARAAAHEDEAALAALPRAVEEARALWRSGKFDSIRVGVLVAAIRDVMADDTLTADEEDRIVRTAAALGT